MGLVGQSVGVARLMPVGGTRWQKRTEMTTWFWPLVPQPALGLELGEVPVEGRRLRLHGRGLPGSVNVAVTNKDHYNCRQPWDQSEGQAHDCPGSSNRPQKFKMMPAYIRNYIDHPITDRYVPVGASRELPRPHEVQASIVCMLETLDRIEQATDNASVGQ